MLRHASARLLSRSCAPARAGRGLATAPHRPLARHRVLAVAAGARPAIRPAPARLIHTSPTICADQPFKLADIGEGITEVSVVKWLIKEGDDIEEFDALCEVQSDKSTVELTAPYTGKIKTIKFAEGDTIKVGQVICTITTEGERESEAAEDAALELEQPNTSATESLSSGAEEASTGETSSPLAQTQTPPTSQAEPQASSPDTSYTSAPVPPTEPDPQGHQQIRRTATGEIIIPPPPPRQIVRPTQLPSESMSIMDRALLASLRAAAEAGEAADAALEAAEILAPPSEADYGTSSTTTSDYQYGGGGSFSGEGSVVRQEAPKREVNTAPVPERTAGGGETKDIVKASPAVRVMAARLGVKLEEIKGTGPGGRVTQQDVQNAVPRPLAPKSPGPQSISSRTAVSAPVHQLATSPERSKIPELTKVEFGRTRKVMYRAMGDQVHVPHFGYSHTLNLTPLLPYIKALNAPPSPSAAGYLASDIPLAEARNPLSDAPKQKTTLLSFLVKGLILAMEEHPIMRARAREQGSSRFLDIGRDGVVGIAVSGKLPSRRCGRMFRSFFADIIIPAFIPDLADPKFGLVTPSLPRLPPTAGLSTITSALSALRQNPTKPTSPANITISSVGGLGEARGAMPVLPPGGGVAICAVGKARWEVEWKRGQSKTMDWLPEDIEQGGTEAVLRCPVGWSGDHRVLEGAELIAFTETWKKYMEEPWRWLHVD